MREYLKKDIKAFALGIALYFVLSIIYWIYWKLLVSNEVVKINFDHALGTQTWNNHPLLIVSTIISVLILIVPGYLTGWHSKQNATLNGLIAIFVCTSSKFYSSSVVWKNFSFDLSEFYFLLRPWFESLILPVFVGAVSAAAGQYHSRLKKGAYNHSLNLPGKTMRFYVRSVQARKACGRQVSSNVRQKNMNVILIIEPDGSEPLSICARNRNWLVDKYHIDAMTALRYYSDKEPVSERDQDADAKAIDHVRKCPKCREWINHVIPKDIMRRQHRLSKYCYAGMFVAVEEPKKKKNKISFFMFRGEDPCWQIEGVMSFISYCPWCGKKMPEKPFIK